MFNTITVLAFERTSPGTLSAILPDMPEDADAAVGQLAIVDATLCDLLRDLVHETTGQDTRLLTTGKAADKLLALAKRDPSLVTPDDVDWLKRVKRAAEERNQVIHAIARDRCASCGQATQFEHHGVPVDRSPAAVARVASDVKALIDEGVNLACLISERLNAREVVTAKALAASTGSLQTPRQVLIGQNWQLCTACGAGGSGKMTVTLPPLVAVLPP